MPRSGIVSILQLKGFWKFNNLLHDKDYFNLIKKTINENETNLIHYADKRLEWEYIKRKKRYKVDPLLYETNYINTFINNLLKEINLLL